MWSANEGEDGDHDATLVVRREGIQPGGGHHSLEETPRLHLSGGKAIRLQIVFAALLNSEGPAKLSVRYRAKPGKSLLRCGEVRGWRDNVLGVIAMCVGGNREPTGCMTRPAVLSDPATLRGQA